MPPAAPANLGGTAEYRYGVMQHPKKGAEDVGALHLDAL
jgi:hypothetical protein